MWIKSKKNKKVAISFEQEQIASVNRSTREEEMTFLVLSEPLSIKMILVGFLRRENC